MSLQNIDNVRSVLYSGVMCKARFLQFDGLNEVAVRGISSGPSIQILGVVLNLFIGPHHGVHDCLRVAGFQQTLLIRNG